MVVDDPILLELGVILGIVDILGKRIDFVVDILKSFANESAKIGFCFSNHVKISSLETFFVDGGIFQGSGNVEVRDNVELLDFPSGFNGNAAGFVS